MPNTAYEPGTLLVCTKAQKLRAIERTIAVGSMVEVVLWNTTQPGLFIGKYWSMTFWLSQTSFKEP